LARGSELPIGPAPIHLPDSTERAVEAGSRYVKRSARALWATGVDCYRTRGCHAAEALRT